MLLQVYCDADTDRPLADCSKLVFSLLDPATGQWTEPTAVWDDGTADYAPDACAGENGVYIVWQNAKDFINEEDTLNEIGAKIEISVAHFDSKNNSITVETVTENDIYEAMPNICLTTEDSLCFDAAGGGAGYAAVRGACEAQGGGRHAVHGTLPHTGAPHGGCAVHHDAAGPDWYCRPCGIRPRADIRLYQVSADPVHTRLRRRDSRISLEGDTLRGVLYAGADGVGFQYIG